MIITGLLIAMPSPIYRVAGMKPAPWPGAPFSANSDSQDPVSLTRAIAVADSVVAGGVRGE